MLNLEGFFGWHSRAEAISVGYLITRRDLVAGASQGSQGIGSLTAQVIAGLVVAFIAGLVGAWYQMRRRRARPFLVPEAFTRELFDTQTTIRLPQSVVDQLSGSAYLSSFGAAISQLDTVEECVRSCEELQEQGEQLLEALGEIMKAIRRDDDDNKLKVAMRSAMSMGFFDKILMSAAKGRRLADDETWREEMSKADQLDAEFKKSGLKAAPVSFFSPNGAYLQFGLPGRQ